MAPSLATYLFRSMRSELRVAFLAAVPNVKYHFSRVSFVFRNSPIGELEAGMALFDLFVVCYVFVLSIYGNSLRTDAERNIVTWRPSFDVF